MHRWCGYHGVLVRSKRHLDWIRRKSVCVAGIECRGTVGRLGGPVTRASADSSSADAGDWAFFGCRCCLSCTDARAVRVQCFDGRTEFTVADDCRWHLLPSSVRLAPVDPLHSRSNDRERGIAADVAVARMECTRVVHGARRIVGARICRVDEEGIAGRVARSASCCGAAKNRGCSARARGCRRTRTRWASMRRASFMTAAPTTCRASPA